MNRFATLVLAVMVGGAGVSASGCKFFEKKVPDDIVQKALTQTLRHAPYTASAMCGADIRGFANSTVTIKSRGEKSTGVAHVKGTPWPSASDDVPSSCEGDIEFAFSYSTKTYGTKRNRRTETTWFLDKMLLVAVQTKGVKFKEAKEEKPDENADDEEGGDDKPAKKGDDKGKKKKASDD